MHLSPASQFRSFRFTGDERLYTDHHGRRIVCDVEGEGRYRTTGAVEVAEGSTGAGKFDGTLVAFAGPGDCGVDVLSGPSPTGFKATHAAKSVEGCGWIVSARAPIQVDGSHEPLQAEPAFPVPFFLSADSMSPMEVALSQQRVILIDQFQVDDPEALKARDWRVQNASDVFELDSAFQDGTRLVASHLSHLNGAHWRVEVPQPNDGLLLYRLYDRFHGRQRARVFVDGRPAGWWYEPRESRKARWA
ncbi:MAG TPA: hypothetical protein VNI20_05105, partial [Fimbriimonadaceae bacterium]|nr:hypothetical protein [Fimbriimonadaceae bacterium]